MRVDSQHIETKVIYTTEYFCDICKEKILSDNNCHICNRNICSKHAVKYNRYHYCTECYEIGREHTNRMNNYRREVVKLKRVCLETENENMKLWKDAALEHLASSKEE